MLGDNMDFRGSGGGSVVANRVESEEYRELTSYEVFVCV